MAGDALVEAVAGGADVDVGGGGEVEGPFLADGECEGSGEGEEEEVGSGSWWHCCLGGLMGFFDFLVLVEGGKKGG